MIEKADVTRAVFYGLGADGTVGANKNSVKIIAEDAGLYAQGYFVYDSPQIRRADDLASALRARADPRALSDRPGRLRRLPPVRCAGAAGSAAPRRARRHVAAERAVLRPPRSGTELPRPVQQTIIDKKLRLFVIDASAVAREVGLGARTNTVLQTCFFAISGVLPREKAIGHIKEVDPQDLRAQGPERRRQELRRRRRHPGAAERSHRPGAGHQPRSSMPAAGPGRRAGFRPQRDRPDVRRPGRRHSGQPDTGRRHLSVRHRRLRKAQCRRERAGLARGPLHPMRTMQLRLPAQRHPRQIL